MSGLLGHRGVLMGDADGGGGSDPYWASVVSLLHFDGADGSTTFTDEKGLTWSSAGASLTTTSPLFGSASGLFATNNIIGCTNSVLALATGDFVIEQTVKASSLIVSFIFDFRPDSINGKYPCLYMNANGSLVYYVDLAARITTAASTIGTSVAHHVVVERYGSTTTLYVDGTSRGTWTDSTDYLVGTASIGGGNQPARSSWAGRIDEWRVTKGVARYKGAFTPPTAPFPNS